MQHLHAVVQIQPRHSVFGFKYIMKKSHGSHPETLGRSSLRILFLVDHHEKPTRLAPGSNG